MNLEDLLKQLAVIRRDLRQLEGEYDGLKRSFDEETAALAGAIKGLKAQEKSTYEAVCAAALQAARETGDLRPDGVEIRAVQDVQYDEQSLIRWALQHAPDVLRIEVNKRALTVERARQLQAAGAPVEVEHVRKPFVPAALGHLLMDEE